MQVSSSPFQAPYKFFALPGEKKLELIDSFHVLRTFPTTGDGSCGIHALCGLYDPKKKVFHLDNVEKKRAELASWVQNCFNYSPLPKLLEEVFNDYIKYPREAPAPIRNLFSSEEMKEKSQLIKMFNSPANTDLELLHTALKQVMVNPLFQEAYLKHLRCKTSHLSPAELQAFAWYEEVNLIVYQGDKSVGRGGFLCDQILSRTANTVEIYLDRRRHFERANKIEEGDLQNLQKLPSNFEKTVKEQLKAEEQSQKRLKSKKF